MADPKWLKDLGDSVQGAIKEIAKLRRQNKSLATQLEKAKKAVAEAQEAAAQAPLQPNPEAEVWRQERKELRRRVARLSKTLEEIA